MRNFQLLLLFLLCLNSVYSQQHTITSFSPQYAGPGDIVTITGTNFSSITNVSFGGTSASSFTVVNSTTIKATVSNGGSGNVTVTKSGVASANVNKSGFVYSSLPTVTDIITDYGTYWKTSTTTPNPVYPNNSHNLLSFSYKGTTYSTGVNDSRLSANGITFTAGNFHALPVTLNGTTSGSALYLAMGSKIDGTNAAGLFTHPSIKDNTIQSVLTDGLNGLDLGTGYTNLPSTASSDYMISTMQVDKISDDEPDIIVTQIAEPTAGQATDVYRFLDGNGNVVGNSMSIDLSKIASLGNWYLDLFTVSNGIPFTSAKPTSTGSSNTTREIRFVAFKLSDFGINASNYTQIRKLQIVPSGVSDVAFVAYNANAINAAPTVTINTTTTNSVICASGGAAYIEANATASYGETLTYLWEVSTNSGSSWSTVSNGGVYSGATTNALTISSATAGYQYRITATEVGSGASSTSSVVTITSTTNSALAGTLNPTSFSNCINATTGTTQLSVNPSGGTGTYSYQWMSSTSSTSGFTNISGATSRTYSPSLATSGVMYYKVIITSGCLTNTSNAASVTISGNSISSTTDGTTCSSGTVTLGATATGGTINWYSVASGGTSLATGTSYTTGSISSTTTYYVSTTTGSCVSARMSVQAIVASTVSLSSSNFSIYYATNVCSGSASLVSLTSSALANGTYTVDYAISGANSITSQATMTFVDGYGTFSTDVLNTIGSNTLTINSLKLNSCSISISSGNTYSISVNGTNPSITSFSVVVSNGCQNISNVATVTSTSLSSGTYVVNYSVAGTNTLATTSAQMVFDSGTQTGTFTLPELTNYGGSNTLTVESIYLLSSPTCVSYPSVTSSSFVVNAIVSLDAGAGKTMCASNSSLNIASGTTASNYSALSWSTSGTGSFTNNSTANALTSTTYSPSVADISAGSVLLTLTATANAGCSNQAKTLTLTISPISVGGTVSGSSGVCSGTNSTTLTLSGHTGSVTKWQYASTSDFASPTDVANTSTSLVVTDLSSTRYYRAVVTNSVCSSANSSFATITVSNPPSAGSLSGVQSICELGTSTFSSTQTGGTWTTSNSSIATANSSSGLISGVSAGTATITYTVTGTGGCSDATATRTVTVTATPSAGTLSGNQAVCVGSTTTFSSTVSGGTWSSSANSIATVDGSGIVSGVSTGSATIYYNVTGTGGCSNAIANRTVTVTAPPSVGTLSGNQSICVGSTTTFSSSVSGGTWSSGNSSVATVDVNSGLVNGLTAGSSVMTYTVSGTGGCSNATETRTVTVTISTVNTGSITLANEICIVGSTTASNAVAGGVWSSTNTSVASVDANTGVISPLSTGSTSIVYTVTGTGGCSDASVSKAISVVNPVSTSEISSGDFIWKGGSSGVETNDRDWLTNSNWFNYNGSAFSVSTSLPTNADNVFIGGTNGCVNAQPHIYNNTPICKNLTILSNGSLTSGSGTLSVYGNWTNNGVWACGTGLVVFKNTGTHTIGGTVTTNDYYQLQINKPSGGVAYLNKGITIANQLSLTNGLLDINVYSVDLASNEIIGGSKGSYVKTSSTGYLKRNVSSSAVFFPVGRSDFNPCELVNSGTSDLFRVRVYDNVTDDAVEENSTTSLPAVQRTWLIEEAVTGGSNVSMKLFWNGTVTDRLEEINAFDYNTAYIAHFSGTNTKWEDKGGNCPSGPGYVLQTGITDFSPFTISSQGGLGYNNPLPVELSSFTGRCSESAYLLKWTTESENNSDYFVVENSNDGTNWIQVDIQDAAGNSTNHLEYVYEISNSKINIGQYFRLNQVDIDNKSKVYGPISVLCDATSEFKVNLFPNPGYGNVNITIFEPESPFNTVLQVTNIEGKLIEEKEISIQEGTNFIEYNLNSENEGIYYFSFDHPIKGKVTQRYLNQN